MVLQQEAGAADPNDPSAPQLGCCGAFNDFVQYPDAGANDCFEEIFTDDYGTPDTSRLEKRLGWGEGKALDHKYRPVMFAYIAYSARSGARFMGDKGNGKVTRALPLRLATLHPLRRPTAATQPSPVLDHAAAHLF